MSVLSILPDLLALSDSDPTTYEGQQKIRAAWQADLDATPSRAKLYYAAFHDAVTALIATCRGERELDQSQATVLMAYASLFASGTYLGRFVVKSAFFDQLCEYNPAFLACLAQVRDLPDTAICPPLPFVHQGRLSDVVDNILVLYRSHMVYGTARGIELQGEIQSLCPGLLKAFPAPRHPAALFLLGNHPDVAPVVAGLIRARITAPALDAEEVNPLSDIAGQMLGYHARRDDPLHAKAGAIIAQALKIKPPLSDHELTLLRDCLVLGPLDMRPVTQEKALEGERRAITMWEKQLAQDVSLGRSQAYSEKRLAGAQRALSLIQSDFDVWLDQRLVKAARHLAVSKAARKAVDALTAALPAHLRAPLDAMTTRADTIASQPVIFALPKSPDTAFRDFGLKLLVIEELMYRQAILTPRFDIHAFAAEYTKRQISVEDDGYAQIPEVLRYFKALPIAPALLEKVTALHQSSGLDGGPAYMQHLHPFWDPGAGDMPVKVTAKAIDDLALLPNLTRITGLENSAPGAKLRAALKARGIANLPEDARGQ
jgi:hypothetical protein